MNEDRLRDAKELKYQIGELEKDLRVWEEDFINVVNLACLKGWRGDDNPDVFTINKVSNRIFQKFRTESIRFLKDKIARLTRKFNKL